jgi:dihydrolipoamide dehydrogenase
MDENYDVIVIGGKAGGVAAAIRAAQLGAKVAVVEKDKRYGEILGVHMIGDNAAEMIGQGALAIQQEMTLEELAQTTFPHPTLSESIAEAARDALGQAIYLPWQVTERRSSTALPSPLALLNSRSARRRNRFNGASRCDVHD